MHTKRASRRKRSTAVATAVALAAASFTTFPALAATAADLPAAALHYAFDDAGAVGALPAGSPVPDGSAGPAHPGSVVGNGVSLVAGLSGEADDRALSLPGGASSAGGPFVQIAPGVVPAGTTDVTLSAWVRWSGSPACTWPFTLGSSQTQHVLFTTSCGTGAYGAVRAGTEVRANGSGPIASARWTHLAVVVDGGTSVSTYVDGERVGTAATTATAAAAKGTATFSGYLGKSFYPADAYWNGTVDDFRVYTEALSGEQIVAAASDARGGAEVLVELDAQRLSVPSSAVGRLVLPDAGRASSISWASSAPEVIAVDGTVTRQSTDQTVTLTATLTGAQGVTATCTFTVTVPAVTAAELSASVVIPNRITDDLVADVAGRDVTWSGASDWVSAEGDVTRPAAGEDAVDVQLTATIGETVLTGAAKILPEGGDALTYVSAGGNVFAGEDLLAPSDSRRSDSLHLALRADGAEEWSPLNRGQALLYVKWNGDQKTQAGKDWQMGSPTLHRDADGRLGAVASANENRTGVYVWGVAEDGVTFTGERYLTVTDAKTVVKQPRIVYDAAVSRYKIFWLDGSDAAWVSVFASLAPGSTAEAVHPAYDVRADAEGPLPAKAIEATEFALSDDEAAALSTKYGALVNTGVSAVEIEVDAGADVGAALPETVELSYNDGTAKQLGVQWDAEDLEAAAAAAPGSTVEVEGAVQQDAYGYPFLEERADPHVFFNEDDGHYYATGSYYPVTPQNELFTAATSYGALGLRRAPTIDELRTAPEHLLRESKVGDRWAGFFWAPEIHKINGTWYIVVGARDYGAGGRKATDTFSWCTNTILIPFVGTTEDIKAGKFLDPAYWGTDAQISILTGAPAFDVSYYLDDLTGQGYWILPNTPSGARVAIAKAATGAGVVPQIEGPRTQISAIQWPWEYGVQDGSITAANPEGTDQGIVEGPYLFSHGDDVYITYSGATVDKYYTLGLLRAAKGSDLMNAASWTPVGYPLLTSYDTHEGAIGGAPHVGGGHNSIVKDPHGNLALVYHARPHPDPHAGQPGAGGLFDPDRHTMIKSINVRADGTLDLAITAEQEVAPEHRTVTATVKVRGAVAPADVGVTHRCVAGKVSTAVTVTNTGAAALTGSLETPWGSRNIANLAAGKSTSVAFTTRVPSVPGGSVVLHSKTAEGADLGSTTASFAAHSCG